MYQNDERCCSTTSFFLKFLIICKLWKGKGISDLKHFFFFAINFSNLTLQLLHTCYFVLFFTAIIVLLLLILFWRIFFFRFGKMLSKSPKLVVSWKRPNNSGIHTGYLSSCEQSMVQIRVTDSKSEDIDIDFSKNE